MREQYMVPELKFVGKADQVVQGSLGAGDDIRSEFLIVDSEFESDR